MQVIRKFARSRRLIRVGVIVTLAGVGSYLLTSTHTASPPAKGTATEVSNSLSGGGTQVGAQDSSRATAARSGTAKTATTSCNYFTATQPVSQAFCDNFTDETQPSVSRSGPLSPVWGVSRVTTDANTPQGVYDDWAGSSFGAEDDTPENGHGPCGSQATTVVNHGDISVTCPG